MLDCLNDDELHTLYGYLQRIIDASSDGVPASTAEDHTTLRPRKRRPRNRSII